MLAVTDRDPQVYFVSLDNTGPEDGEEWRMMLGYQNGNLFNRDHTLTATYTTAPADTEETRQFGLNYHIPMYAHGGSLDILFSDSDSAGETGGESDAGESIAPGTCGSQALEITGQGTVIGAVYRRPLLTDGNFSHEGSLGLQHKRFDNESEFGDVQFTGAEAESTPLETGYYFNRAAPGSSFFGSITLVQETGDNDDEYDEDRPGAESGWTAWRYNITYDLLFAQEHLFHAGFSGQLSDALLISGEQFGVGGVGTMRVSNGTATMQLLTGEFVTRNLVLDPTSALAGDPVTVLSKFFWGGGGLPGQLTTSPGSSMRISAPNVVLPAESNIQGSVFLDNPAGVILDLNGNPLVSINSTLSGAGEVIGDVNNVSGVVLPGGPGNLDNLRITGNYSQGSNSALVVEVFNNGITTVAEQFEVTGQANLAGTLVIGFTTNSLGIVTANFNPFVLNSVNGRFNRVIDAGGNILFINFTGNGFTIVGVSPKIPDAVIGELISFIRESEELSEKAASNKSEADGVMQELLKEEGEEGSLSCNI